MKTGKGCLVYLVGLAPKEIGMFQSPTDADVVVGIRSESVGADRTAEVGPWFQPESPVHWGHTVKVLATY